MIFVLTMLLTFVYDRKNENHWSLLVTQYSLLVTHYSEYKHPIRKWFLISALILFAFYTGVQKR